MLEPALAAIVDSEISTIEIGICNTAGAHRYRWVLAVPREFVLPIHEVIAKFREHSGLDDIYIGNVPAVPLSWSAVLAMVMDDMPDEFVDDEQERIHEDLERHAKAMDAAISEEAALFSFVWPSLGEGATAILAQVHCPKDKMGSDLVSVDTFCRQLVDCASRFTGMSFAANVHPNTPSSVMLGLQEFTDQMKTFHVSNEALSSLQALLANVRLDESLPTPRSTSLRSRRL